MMICKILLVMYNNNIDLEENSAITDPVSLTNNHAPKKMGNLQII